MTSSSKPAPGSSNIRMATYGGQPVPAPEEGNRGYRAHLLVAMVLLFLFAVIYVVLQNMYSQRGIPEPRQTPTIVTQLYSEYPELAEYNNSLLKQIEGYQIASQGLTEQLSSLREENRILQNNLDEVSDVSSVTVSVVQDDISRLIRENNDLQDRLRFSLGKTAKLESANTRLQSQLESVREQYRDNLDVKSTALKLAINENGQLNKRNNELMGQFELLLAEKNNLAKKTTTDEERITTLTEKIKNIRDETLARFKILQQENMKLSAKIDNHKIRSRSLAETVDILEKKNSGLNRKLDKSRNESKEIIDRQNTTLAAADSKITALNKQLKSAASRNNNLEETNKSLQGSLEKTRSEYAMLLKNHETLAGVNEALTEKTGRLETGRASLDRQLNEMSELMAAEKTTSTEKISNLTRELQVALNEVELSHEQIKTLQKQVSLSRKAEAELDSKLANYRNEVNTIREKISEQNKQSDEALSLMTASNEELQTENRQLADYIKKLEKQNTGIEDRVVNLQTQLEEAQRQQELGRQANIQATAKYTASVAVVQNNRRNLQEQLQQQESTVLVLENKIGDMDSKYSDLSRKYEQKIKENRELTRTVSPVPVKSGMDKIPVSPYPLDNTVLDLKLDYQL